MPRRVTRASSPSEASIRTTSGDRAAAEAMAAELDVASPTTARPSATMMLRSPARTSALASAIRTRRAPAMGSSLLRCMRWPLSLPPRRTVVRRREPYRLYRHHALARERSPDGAPIGGTGRAVDRLPYAEDL